MEHGLRRIFTDEGMLISSRMQKVLACNGVALSVIEIQEIANARAQAIRDVGGIELNAEGLLGYVAAVLALPCLPSWNAKDFLAEACGLFYETRAALSVAVPDAEITEALCEAISEYEGALETVDLAFVIDKLQKAYSEGEPYKLVDDEGRVYRWDPAEWDYDECSEGWEGEKWEDDADAL